MTKKPNDSCLRLLLGITGLLITSSNGRTLKIQSEACGRLRRSHPQGREAGRSARAGADQIRNDPQPQNRQGARHRGAGDAARSRRQGDRMKRREFITLVGGAAAWGFPVHAAEPRPRIAVLSINSAQDERKNIARGRTITVPPEPNGGAVHWAGR